MLLMMPLFFNNNNTVAMAQGYDDNNYYYGDNSNSYSQYPTDDKKYECKTGPFKGFFVSSVEFCKHVKFDDRKDHTRDNRTGTQGSPGPPGPAGPQGERGFNGTQGERGPSGITQLINDSNIYKRQDFASGNSTTTDPATLQAFAKCDPGDFVLTGGFDTIGFSLGGKIISVEHNTPTIFVGNGAFEWFTRINVIAEAKTFLTVQHIALTIHHCNLKSSSIFFIFYPN